MIDHLDILYSLARDGKWEEYKSYVVAHPDAISEAFAWYELLPDTEKYSLAVECYSTDRGSNNPQCRKAVREAPKYGHPALPPEIESSAEITVYRAGSEPLEKAKLRLSWTTSLSVAKWFQNRKNSFTAITGYAPCRIYKARIRPQKIIAFINDRNEHEVVQYRSVYDIEDITPSV